MIPCVNFLKMEIFSSNSPSAKKLRMLVWPCTQPLNSFGVCTFQDAEADLMYVWPCFPV
jgi:hypothetical protein